MTDDDELLRFTDDEGHPVARVGLRALAEERASEAAKRRALAAMATAAKGRPHATTTFVVAVIVGLLLGLLWLWTRRPA